MQDEALLPETATAQDSQENLLPYRRGKIARLSRELREELNVMMADNRPYAEIIAKFKPHLPDLNEDNLTRWRKGGFVEWLKHHDWIDRVSVEWDMAKDFVADEKAAHI